MKLRTARLRRLAGIGFDRRRFVKSGLVPVVDYDAVVNGFNDQELACVRKHAHAAIVWKPSSRSTTADLSLAGRRFDPAYKLCTATPLWFAAGLWNKWLPRDIMMHCFILAYEKMSNDLMGIYELRSSKKHMVNLDMSQYEGKPHLAAKFKNVV